MFVGRIKDGVVKIELVTEQGAFGGHVKECLWSTMVDHMKQPIVVGLQQGCLPWGKERLRDHRRRTRSLL